MPHKFKVGDIVRQKGAVEPFKNMVVSSLDHDDEGRPIAVLHWTNWDNEMVSTVQTVASLELVQANPNEGPKLFKGPQHMKKELEEAGLEKTLTALHAELKAQQKVTLAARCWKDAAYKRYLGAAESYATMRERQATGSLHDALAECRTWWEAYRSRRVDFLRERKTLAKLEVEFRKRQSNPIWVVRRFDGPREPWYIWNTRVGKYYAGMNVDGPVPLVNGPPIEPKLSETQANLYSDQAEAEKDAASLNQYSPRPLPIE